MIFFLEPLREPVGSATEMLLWAASLLERTAPVLDPMPEVPACPA
jgi:hypothetical protein